MSKYNEAELEARQSQLDLYAGQLDAELADQDTRESTIQGRAGILTGASAVLGTLQIAVGSSGLIVGYLVLSFLAAILGLLVTAPTLRKGLKMDLVEPALLERTPREAEYRLAREKLWILNQREPWLTVRAAMVFLGYVLLIVGFALFLLANLQGQVP